MVLYVQYGDSEMINIEAPENCIWEENIEIYPW